MARRPQQLNDFIGQPRVLSFVRRLVTGARMRGEPVPWLAIIGRAGMGKTVLATAIARDYARVASGARLTSFHQIIGGKRATVKLAEKFQSLEFGDVVFIDEAHALDRESQELLYLAKDEGRTFAVDNGHLDRTKTVSVVDFTLIVATTEPGKLLKPLLSRLMPIELDPYTEAELREIVGRVAASCGLELTGQAARHLATHSDGTPRSIGQLVHMIAVLSAPTTKLSQEHVRDALRKHGIDERGLTTMQRALLGHLAALPNGRTSLEGLATHLGVDARYVRSVLEPKLVELGLLDFTTAGRRRITDAGRRVVEESRAETSVPSAEPAEERDLN